LPRRTASKIRWPCGRAACSPFRGGSDGTGNNSTGNNSAGNTSTGNNSTGNNSAGNTSTGNTTRSARVSDVSISPGVTFNSEAMSMSWQAGLLEIRVERQLNLPARVTLRFLDPGYSLLASNTIELGTEVKVVDPSDTSVVLFEGEVTGIGADQRVGEQPEVVVVAHDKSHRMARSTCVQTFMNMTYNAVVSKVADKYGFTASVSGSSTLQTYDYLLQVDSDLGLVTELARRSGCDWWFEPTDQLVFGQPTESTTVGLALGTELLSFSAMANGQRPDSVVVDGWDRDSQEIVTGTATSPSTSVLATGDLAKLVSTPGKAFGTAQVMTSTVGAQTQDEAGVLSQAILDRQAAASVEATGIALGNGKIAPGVVVAVSGAGPLSGNYPVTAVVHSYRPRRGFQTRFRSGDRQPIALVDTMGRGGSGAAGSVVPHAGVTVGEVTNINDPKTIGRVKVRFPGLSASEESAWARIAVLGGGANRGNVFIPEVGDEVLVAFEGGDTRTPVVVGGLYGNKSTIPAPDIENGLVQKRQITSRLGNTLSMLDGTTPATQAIELVLAGGQFSIHLGKDKLAMTVPAQTPVSVTAGSSSFAIANDGGITMQAPTISIKADQQVQIQGATVSVVGTGELSLQAQGTAGLKGATVQVQSEGPASITGTPVSIN